MRGFIVGVVSVLLDPSTSFTPATPVSSLSVYPWSFDTHKTSTLRSYKLSAEILCIVSELQFSYSRFSGTLLAQFSSLVEVRHILSIFLEVASLSPVDCYPCGLSI